jgi:group II intron reverse transcriptase/maturase
MAQVYKKPSESWKGLPWKQFRKNLFRLQKRLYAAIGRGSKRRARNLQKLILRSRSARMLAIRQVTQLNRGKKTPGIDGKAKLSFAERFRLEVVLKKHIFRWKHRKLREISIPKKDGTQRLLKVPTLQDRAWQCLVKYALEPVCEAGFHQRSYGFRPGRSCQDAQKKVFHNLRSQSKGYEKRILELDIEKCFDRIDHKFLMAKIQLPKSVKRGLKTCLKAGIDPEFPEQGTCQGGVISPLLANIALHGIEEIHYSIRYADDIIFILKPKDDAAVILQRVKAFLALRGLQIKPSKTKLVTAQQGFDFLGWNFKVQANQKFRSTPSQENFLAFKAKVKSIVLNSNYGAQDKAKKLGPIVRGWRNYHRYCKMDGSQFSLWPIRARAWKVFNRESKRHKDSTTQLIDQAFPYVPFAENRQVNVRGNKSPFDGDILYWAKRNSKQYLGLTARLLRKQHHTCNHCGLLFDSQERIQIHHIDGQHHNWNPNNVAVVHSSCHHYIHMGVGALDCRELDARKRARPVLKGRGGV